MLSFRCSIPQVTYTPITSQGSYPEYVAMFDQLTDDRVIWTLYTQERVNVCAPEGLSSMCTRDYVYWYTRRAVEPVHARLRVLVHTKGLSA